jgi:hypothetical protein
LVAGEGEIGKFLPVDLVRRVRDAAQGLGYTSEQIRGWQLRHGEEVADRQQECRNGCRPLILAAK